VDQKCLRYEYFTPFLVPLGAHAFERPSLGMNITSPLLLDSSFVSLQKLDDTILSSLLFPV